MRLENLDSFIALVELDAQVNRFLKEQKHIAQRIYIFAEQLTHLQKQLSERESIIHSLKKKNDALQLDIKTLDDVLLNRKKRIDLAQNPKEFFSLEQEIKDASEKKQHLEDQLFVIWHELEAQEEAYAPFKQEIESQINLIQLQQAELQKELDHVSKRIDQLHAQRPTLVSHVPKDALDNYANMLQANQNPVVPIIKDSCSGCFYGLTAQDVTASQKNQLVRCRECHRLLYALQQVRQA